MQISQKKEKKAVLLFPPNWSACVNSSHLALPLLAGSGNGIEGWEIEIKDLSADYYFKKSGSLSTEAVSKAVLNKDYQVLDQLYFSWEDEIQTKTADNGYGNSFRLLSGYSFSELNKVKLLSDVLDYIRYNGSVYTSFLTDDVIPKLMKEKPSVIAVSISSSNQLIPALELLTFLKEYMPDVFILLGGNVVTRLRGTSAMKVFTKISDQVVLFQGELAFRNILQIINEIGVHRAKQKVNEVAGDQFIPLDMWPIPSFKGIRFDQINGKQTIPYVSTRGCYWGRCSFCAIPSGWSENSYAGSNPMECVLEQIQIMIKNTGVTRIKFVDECMHANKVIDACKVFQKARRRFEWEAYARLEPAWENDELLVQAYKIGLRKLYFGLEQVPTTSRGLMNKHDKGNYLKILDACNKAQIAVHFFCMVGFPGTSNEEAESTTRFLIDNQNLIDTADLVGFRLDRGTRVPSINPLIKDLSDWKLTIPYEPDNEIMSSSRVSELEFTCQDALWENAPHLLHPLYRLVNPWIKSGNSIK
jgi:Radical SAM superfamily